MIVLPKTANLEHMKSNADVDFGISDEDMEILEKVERIKNYGEQNASRIMVSMDSSQCLAESCKEMNWL